MVQNGNDFMERLYQDEHRRLHKIAYRMLHSRELAQDLVQETFLLAMFHQQKLMRHPKPEGWLTLTLCNLIKNEQRSQSHHEIPLDEVVDVPDKVRENVLDELLPIQLQAKEREILIWRFEQQMSYKEMSMRLGVSEDICRKRVSQAVNKCRKHLREFQLQYD